MYDIILLGTFDKLGGAKLHNEGRRYNEQERFINELDKGYDDYTIVFYIAIYTGMRISEILALKREDLDFENKKIYVRKTLSHVDKGRILLEKTTKTYAGMRDVPILNVLYDKLIEYKIDKKKGFLFLKNGSFIHATNFNARFQKLCKNADIRVYKKRSSIKSGRKIKKVYEILNQLLFIIYKVYHREVFPFPHRSLPCLFCL